MAIRYLSQVQTQFQKKDIKISNEWLRECLHSIEPCRNSFDAFEKAWNCFLNSNIRESVTDAVLPTSIDSLDHLEGRFILQIDEIIDIHNSRHSQYTAHKEQEEMKRLQKVMDIAPVLDKKKSDKSLPIMKLFLTDGIHSIVAMEYQPIRPLHSSLPGCKVEINNPLVRRGVVLLTERSFKLLGGHIQELEKATDDSRKRQLGSLDPLLSESIISTTEHISDITRDQAETQKKRVCRELLKPKNEVENTKLYVKNRIVDSPRIKKEIPTKQNMLDDIRKSTLHSIPSLSKQIPNFSLTTDSIKIDTTTEHSSSLMEDLPFIHISNTSKRKKERFKVFAFSIVADSLSNFEEEPFVVISLEDGTGSMCVLLKGDLLFNMMGITRELFLTIRHSTKPKDERIRDLASQRLQRSVFSLEGVVEIDFPVGVTNNNIRYLGDNIEQLPMLTSLHKITTDDVRSLVRNVQQQQQQQQQQQL